jgi:cytochrome c-type biogenesis protein CcmH
MKMGDHQGAVRAYRKLLALMPDNTTAKISLVDALSMVDGGNVPDEAVTLLDEILKEEPEAITALWLAGNAAHQREQFVKAQAYWERAYPLLSGQPGMQQELGAMLAQVSQQTGKAWDAPALATGAAITVNVALAPEYLEKISEDDTVFIYAKAQKGPPMPVAVARHKESELPIQVILTDAMAMMPQMTLSTTKDVLIGARVSKTGQAIAQSGDLQADEVAMTIGSTEPVSLLINQIKP